MDGTYGNVYPQGRTASPMTPGTPTAYQTNINRTKTKKWVEAKVQNYDGDDWGDDYDDEEPEEPPPPSRPTGLRQPGQGATEHTPMTSPYGQAPTPHAAGPRAMPMPSHVRKTSTGLRTPSGAPPLHVQTQPHQTNFPNELGHSSGSGSTSGLPLSMANSFPQPPGMPRQNPPNAPGPAMSPSTQTRGRSSSSTQAPGTAASARFPPRKSSMSRQDMSDPADVSSPRSGSRPGSSSGSARPWMDQRTNSPGQAANVSGKPLPFVRPADIYRRMEEEKQRTSLDSSRPSMDSNDGGALRSPSGERRRGSLERDDLGSESSRGLKTTLAPVAERRSEYGMDRMMSDSNNKALGTSGAHNHMDDDGQNSITEEQSRLNKLELQSSRRLSVSPQLPDLTRMSGFGEDFFGGSHSAQERPQYFLENPEPIAGSRGSNTTENNVSDQPHRAPSLIEGPALDVSQESKDSATQPTLTAPKEANAAATSGGFGGAQDQMTSTASKAPRPSIPGGWVSETTNFGSEAPTPMENTDLRSRQLSPPQEEVSPITESGEDLVPTTAVKQAQPLDTTPKMALQNDGFGGATGKHDQDVANGVVPTGPASHATPMSLPPLQTSGPEPLSDTQRENTNPTSTTSQPEVSPSQFVPTAPLNPRRMETSEGTFVATMPPRNLTMSSIDTTSPNESDRLRDDIMKSLNASPIHSAGAGALLGPSSGSIDTGLSRESTYLSGVYDDYLGPAEDKSLQETGQAMKDAGKNNQPIYQLPSQIDAEHLSFPVPPSNQPHSETTRVPAFKRRFSWEGGPEEVSSSPTTDTNAPFVGGADTSQDPAKSPTSSQSGPTAAVTVEPSTAPTPAVQIAADNDGNMSHQVSMVSSRGPEGLGIAGLEPPSPVSVLSNRKSLVSPGIDNSRRLSLADEKSLMEEASQPPSPPRAQHPALAQAPAAEESMNATPAPQVGIGRASSYPMAWAEILSLPTLPMRAEKFEEARIQYAEMDSGLSNWLLHMQSNADVMNATGSQTHLPQSPTSAGAQASGQQPYYQQYLNASNPNLDTVPSPGLGRQPTGNMLHGQQSSTGFGAAHNQVGTKSKELLQAAAGFANKGTRTGIKSGMKLFNKGKSKFRGGSNGGDKDLQVSGQRSSPPTLATTSVPRKRNEHRTSSGFSVWRWRREETSTQNPTSTTSTATAPSGTRLHWRPRRLRADADAPPRLADGTQQQQQHQQPTAEPPRQGRHNHSRSLPLLSQSQPHKSTPTEVVLPSAARANGKTRPARSSQFSLPFLSSISLFKSFGRSNQSSPWQPPSSVTPEAGILSEPPISARDNCDRAAPGNDEARVQQAPSNSSGYPLDSIAAPTAAAAPSLPVSNSPAVRGWDERVPEPHLAQLAPPVPISKSQPTWDPYTGTPLLEEESFDLDPPFVGHRPVTSQKLSFVASPHRHLPTTHAGPESMAAPMAATFAADPQTPADPYIQPPYQNQHQHQQQQQQQQQPRQPPPPPTRQTSFGLPSIPRTTSFGWGSKKSSTENDARGSSPGARSDDKSLPLPPTEADTSGDEDASPLDSCGASPIHIFPQSTQVQQPYYGHISAQAPSPSASQPLASMSNHIAGQIAPNSPIANGLGAGISHQASNGPDAYASDANRNSPRVPSSSQQQAMGRGSPSLSQPGHMPRQTTSPLMQGQPFMGSLRPNGVVTPGNPVNQLPPSPRWNLQESQLSEPLVSRKTHSPQPGYYAYDKETGVESQPIAAPPQQLQRTGRNSGLPPVAAQKYPGLFPAGSSNPSQIQPTKSITQDQIQVTPVPRQDGMNFSRPSANEFQPGDDNGLRRNPSLSKEMGGKFNGRGSTDGAAGSIRSDDISENSDVLGFDSREQARRVSLQVSHSPTAINGTQPHSQPMQHFRSVSEHVGGHDGGQHEEKKKKPFFGGNKKQPSFSVANSDPSTTKNDLQLHGKDHGLGSARKRLSELKGIFKNNGHEEEPLAKPSAPQAQAQTGRPSISSDNPRPQQGAQIPMWQQQPIRSGQPGGGPGPSPHVPGDRPSMSSQDPARSQPTGMQFDDMQLPSNEDDNFKKPAGGFLGGLFNNRPGSRSHGQPALGGHSMRPQGQPSPPPGQQQVRPGQTSQPGQGPLFDTRMTGVGQPAAPQQQVSPPLGRNSQGFVHMPVQANQRPKIVTIASGSGSPNRTRASTLPTQGGMNAQQPQQQTVAPNRQGAISPQQQTSRDDRPSLPSQQNSFANERPDEREMQRPMGNKESTGASAHETPRAPSITDSPPLSRKSSQERISIGGASMVPRNSPARKPVGSGPARQDPGNSVSVANPTTVVTAHNAVPTAPTSKLQHVKSDSSVTVEPVEDHPALSDRPSLTHMGEKGGFGHSRQVSIPTPSILSAQSPISQEANRSSGHSQHQQLSPKPSTGFNVQPSNTTTPANRQQSTGPTGSQHGNVPGNSPGLVPPQNPHAQTWGPQDSSRPGTMQGLGPQPQNPQQMQNQWRTQTGPAPEHQKPEHQKSTMSKFFGGSKKQQAALQPSNSSAQSKESTKDKLKSVFKRNSKAPEPHQQQHQQQQPQQFPPGQQQQMPMPMVQGGRGAPSQPMPMGMQRPPMGPNGIPQGSFGGPGQAPPGSMQATQGRGQMPPQMMQPMQAGRGQMFLPAQIPPQMLQQMQMQAGRGQQMPPHMAGMLAGRGQLPPQQQQQQSTPGGRGHEPQFPQVPIPQGYQPVHGYGNTGGMAFSPYMYGQQFQGYPSPMQQQQQPHQQFGPSPSNSPPSSHSPFGPTQQQFQGGMQLGMAQGPPQQQFAQAPGFPQGRSQPSPHHSHHSQSPPPQQSMMQTPPPQGQQFGGPVQPSPDNQRRVISPESSQDIGQPDSSSRVSSMSPQNDGGLAKPNLQHIATTLNAPQQQQQQQQANPHIQHPGSPQNYPLPDSAATFSPVNPAAGRLPNPPAPTAESMHGSEPATDKGNISDISHTPSPRSGINGPGVAMTHDIPLADERMQGASLSPDPSRVPHHQVSNQTLNVNVNQANSQSSDTEDIYDATPRKLRSPNEPGPQSDNNGNNNHIGAVGAAAMGGAGLGIAAGVASQQDMAHQGSYFVQPPNDGSPSLATESSTPAAPGDYPATPYAQPGAQQQQQQQPPSATPAEPEEKILVDQPVELAAAPDDLDDGIPVMSATSYPGQEWNPYGYGEFGDFEG